jgi:hypothetical protein
MEQKKALKPKVFVVFLNSFGLRNSACTRFKELGEERVLILPIGTTRFLILSKNWVIQR